MNRRTLLARLGVLGGAAAMYDAMSALGLIAPVQAYSGPPRISSLQQRKSVAILGGGIAGLCCAYELTKAGYDCTLLEARERVGGRNFTARRGQKLLEYDSTQVCDFDEEPDLYFNCGPARIPGHHLALLGYCKELGIPLEVFVNDNRMALLHSRAAFDGKPQRQGRVLNDSRGYIAEMLSKALDQSALEQAVTDQDRELLQAFVGRFGDLSKDGRYLGTARNPYAHGGFLEEGSIQAPLALDDILKSDFWQFKMHFAEMADQATTMMQPTGGMDQIPRAFERRIKTKILYNAPVRSIMNRSDHVQVVYTDPKDGSDRALQADYVINNVPFHLLLGIDNNFSTEYRAALAAVPAGKLFKIGLQARRRFWETDDHIYGGITWTDSPITQIWYPSTNFHGKKGVLLGAYTFSDEDGARFGRMAPQERIRTALSQAEKIHPGISGEIETGVSVAWHKVPHMFGCAANWTPSSREQYFDLLAAPQGRVYLVGDQITHHTGWQEGAIRSAHRAIEQLHARAAAEV